jgi:predicted RNA-binding Zn-ribbon protein involved in translation (DUF1610 family)
MKSNGKSALSMQEVHEALHAGLLQGVIVAECYVCNRSLEADDAIHARCPSCGILVERNMTYFHSASRKTKRAQNHPHEQMH